MIKTISGTSISTNLLPNPAIMQKFTFPCDSTSSFRVPEKLNCLYFLDAYNLHSHLVPLVIQTFKQLYLIIQYINSPLPGK